MAFRSSLVEDSPSVTFSIVAVKARLVSEVSISLGNVQVRILVFCRRIEKGRSVNGFLSRHSQSSVVHYRLSCSEPSAFHLRGLAVGSLAQVLT